MKLGAVTSLIAHTMALSWGLLTITTPKPYQIAEPKSINVEIISYEEFTKLVQGDKTAPVAEIPAPKQTTKPKLQKPAINVGDTKFDTKSTKSTEPSPKPVIAAAPPKSRPETKAKPSQAAEVQPEASDERIPVPTTELAVEPQEKVKVAAIDPQNSPPVTRQAEALPQEEFEKLPDLVPTPRAKPVVAKPKIAKTNERKNSDKPASKIVKAAPKSKSKKNAKDIAALLNRQDPTASGAKRPKRQAALGATKTTGKKLSRGEMDGLRDQIESCFSLPAGMADAEDLSATVKVRLTPDGELDGKPKITASGGNARVRTTFKGAVGRAVLRCAPYDKLPKDKFQTWADLVVNFNLSDML